MPSSMLMSMICAPFSTCWRATSSASSKLPFEDQAREASEPVTLVRSPTLTNSAVGADVERLQAGQAAVVGSSVRRLARRQARARRSAMRADVLRRRAAAAADDVHEAACGELAEHARRLSGARRSRRRHWAGRRWGSSGRRCRRPRQLLDVRAQLSAPSAQLRPIASGRAWRTEFQNASHGLARQGAAGAIGDRARDRSPAVARRSSNSSSSAKIAALALSVSKMVSTRNRSAPPSIRPRPARGRPSRSSSKLTLRAPGSLTSRRYLRGPVRRPERARDEARLVRRALGRTRLPRAGEPRGFEVHLGDVLSSPVIGLGDRGRAEKVLVDAISDTDLRTKRVVQLGDQLGTG